MKNIFKLEIPEKRNFGLDLLRFIAIFTVLVSHSVHLLPPVFLHADKFITDGVLIFFVLSGFLIGRILIRDFQEGITFKKIINFWKRRWFRTLPAYFFTIFILLVVGYFVNYKSELKEVLRTILFVQNLSHAPKYFFTESLSLSIEEWFYLTLPLFLILISSFKTPLKKSIILIFAIILIFSLIIRYLIFIKLNIVDVAVWDVNIRKPVITRLDSILIGVLGAWFFIYNHDFFHNNKNLFFTIGFVIFFGNKIYMDYFMSDLGFYESVIYFTLISFSILLMIPKLFYMRSPKFRSLRNFITYGSLISYSLYLVNSTLIMGLILNKLALNQYFKFLLFWILCLCISTLMYKYIEQPFMRIRDKN